MGSMSVVHFDTKLFINNEFVDARAKRRLTVKNPFDGSIVSDRVQIAGKEDVDVAVDKAKESLTSGPWSSFSGAQRAACMNKLAALVEENAHMLAYVESVTTGRPISTLIHMDIPHLAACFRYYAGWADKIEGESFNADDGMYKIVQHEPLGVCAGIASWNGSFLYVGWKVAPALAAGNAYIFKSSEKSPLGVLKLAGLIREAGFPPGVVQFVSGDAETGAILASHKGIAKISITGSIASGLKVQEAAVKSNLKQVTLELGGKSPALVFEDADFDRAVVGCSSGFLFNSGQVCVAASRCYVAESISEKFIQTLKSKFDALGEKLGADPTDPSTDLGPVVDEQQMTRILQLIERGKQSATLITGGTRKGSQGCFVLPTVFLNPQSDSVIYKEEIFGPVLVVKTFKSEEEVIAMANDTTYGLSGAIYTSNIDRALRLARRLDAGAIALNGPFLPTVQAPFGGFKMSGHGKELGKYGLKEYLRTKTILVHVASR